MHDLDPILNATSRTFALGIHRLPREVARPVTVAYLLLRISDYFEDNRRLTDAAKARALRNWARVLKGEAEPSAEDFHPSCLDQSLPDAKAVQAAPSILAAYRGLAPEDAAVVRTHVTDSTLGMAAWVERGPDFPHEADLDAYMFEVAGRVGLLLTELFAMRSDRVRANAAHMSRLGVEFGLGLQTVNVIRGLHSDRERGWHFVPRDFVPAGMDVSRLWLTPSSPEAMAALDALVVKAMRHLVAAKEYTLGIPRSELGMRVFCLLPLLFATRTLAKARSNPSVFQDEVKLSRREVLAVARRTRLWAWSNRWIEGHWHP
jgi:farnesyl-diphosphate farnesyltransferase